MCKIDDGEPFCFSYMSQEGDFILKVGKDASGAITFEDPVTKKQMKIYQEELKN